MPQPADVEPLAPPTFGVQWLIHPHDPHAFFTQYWEARPLFVQRQQPLYYRDLFSSRHMEEALFYGKPKPPDLRVVADQKELLPGRYVTDQGDLNLNQLYKAFDEGHTLIINGLQRFSPSVATLCGRVQDSINHSIVANVYLSPPDSTGLHPHFDTHDVFVLQIEGAKTWYLYDAPQPTPLLGTFQPVLARENLGEPRQILTLQAGDLLYLPRGVVHHAETGPAPSLHVTLGVYPTQWLDLLTNALTALSLKDVRLRRALPPAFMDRDIRAELRRVFGELAATFQEHGSVDEGLAMVADRFLRTSVALPDGHFGQVSQSRDIAADTAVAKRAGVRCRLLDTGEIIALQFAGNTVQATPPYREAMRFIAGADDPFTPSSLPGQLDDLRKVGLVRRLIRGGLLRAVGGEQG